MVQPKQAVYCEEYIKRFKKYEGVKGTIARTYCDIVIIIYVAIILASWILDRFILLEYKCLGLWIMAALSCLAIKLCLGKRVTEKTPIEFRFYENRLEIHKEKVWIFGCYRKYQSTILYQKITWVGYNKKQNRITVEGDFYINSINYDESGRLLEDTKFCKDIEETDESMCIAFDGKHDLAQIFEENVPKLKVEIYSC